MRKVFFLSVIFCFFVTPFNTLIATEDDDAAANPSGHVTDVTQSSDDLLFEQAYFTTVLNDGDGDFHLLFKCMQTLSDTLPPEQLRKTLFLFNVQETHVTPQKRILSFEKTIRDWLSSKTYKSDVHFFLGGCTCAIMLDMIVSTVSGEEPAFPSYKQQKTPVLHIVGSINSESSYKVWFAELYFQRNSIVSPRKVFFHGEMGSAIGTQREVCFYSLLKQEVVNIGGIIAAARADDMDLMLHAEAAEMKKRKGYKVLDIILKIIDTFFTDPLCLERLTPYIKEELLYLQTKRCFPVSKSSFLMSSQFCGMGFSPSFAGIDVMSAIEQPNERTIPLPGSGVFLSNFPAMSEDLAKNNVFGYIQSIRAQAPYAEILSKAPQFIEGQFEAKNTHIVFCANSRPYAMDFQRIIKAINFRFAADIIAQKPPLILLVIKHLPNDPIPLANARIAPPYFRIIPIQNSIPNILYNALMQASLFFGAAGDNAVMDALSLGVWPFPLYHQTLCKSRDTMFPVSQQEHRKIMLERGVSLGLDRKVIEEVFSFLGSNGDRGANYTDSIPTDEGLQFYKQVISPYIREHFDYTKALLECHKKGEVAYRRSVLSTTPRLVELNKVALLLSIE